MSALEAIVFTRGVPATESFPKKEMATAALDAVHAHGDTILQYGSAFGFQPLREWLAEWHMVEVENVLCSNGSLQIIEFICALLLQDDERTVFIEAPTYDRTITILRKHGAEIVPIPLQSDGPATQSRCGRVSPFAGPRPCRFRLGCRYLSHKFLVLEHFHS